eukprot:jgi/Bigna1/77712/fgenesh1_pg.49_\
MGVNVVQKWQHLDNNTPTKKAVDQFLPNPSPTYLGQPSHSPMAYRPPHLRNRGGGRGRGDHGQFLTTLLEVLKTCRTELSLMPQTPQTRRRSGSGTSTIAATFSTTTTTTPIRVSSGSSSSSSDGKISSSSGSSLQRLSTLLEANGGIVSSLQQSHRDDLAGILDSLLSGFRRLSSSSISVVEMERAGGNDGNDGNRVLMEEGPRLLAALIKTLKLESRKMSSILKVMCLRLLPKLLDEAERNGPADSGAPAKTILRTISSTLGLLRELLPPAGVSPGGTLAPKLISTIRRCYGFGGGVAVRRAGVNSSSRSDRLKADNDRHRVAGIHGAIGERPKTPAADEGKDKFNTPGSSNTSSIRRMRSAHTFSPFSRYDDCSSVGCIMGDCGKERAGGEALMPCSATSILHGAPIKMGPVRRGGAGIDVPADGEQSWGSNRSFSLFRPLLLDSNARVRATAAEARYCLECIWRSSPVASWNGSLTNMLPRKIALSAALWGMGGANDVCANGSRGKTTPSGDSHFKESAPALAAEVLAKLFAEEGAGQRGDDGSARSGGGGGGGPHSPSSMVMIPSSLSPGRSGLSLGAKISGALAAAHLVAQRTPYSRILLPAWRSKKKKNKTPRGRRGGGENDINDAKEKDGKDHDEPDPAPPAPPGLLPLLVVALYRVLEKGVCVEPNEKREEEGGEGATTTAGPPQRKSYHKNKRSKLYQSTGSSSSSSTTALKKQLFGTLAATFEAAGGRNQHQRCPRLAKLLTFASFSWPTVLLPLLPASSDSPEGALLQIAVLRRPPLQETDDARRSFMGCMLSRLAWGGRGREPGGDGKTLKSQQQQQQQQQHRLQEVLLVILRIARGYREALTEEWRRVGRHGEESLLARTLQAALRREQKPSVKVLLSTDAQKQLLEIAEKGFRSAIPPVRASACKFVGVVYTYIPAAVRFHSMYAKAVGQLILRLLENHESVVSVRLRACWAIANICDPTLSGLRPNADNESVAAASVRTASPSPSPPLPAAAGGDDSAEGQLRKHPLSRLLSRKTLLSLSAALLGATWNATYAIGNVLANPTLRDATGNPSVYLAVENLITGLLQLVVQKGGENMDNFKIPTVGHFGRISCFAQALQCLIRAVESYTPAKSESFIEVQYDGQLRARLYVGLCWLIVLTDGVTGSQGGGGMPQNSRAMINAALSKERSSSLLSRLEEEITGLKSAQKPEDWNPNAAHLMSEFRLGAAPSLPLFVRAASVLRDRLKL